MLLRRLKDVSLIQVPFKTSLRLVQLVSHIQVPAVTSLGRLRFIGFVYVPLRRRKDVSNRSVLLTYQLRRRDNVSAWSRTFKLVTRMGQFILGTRQQIFSASQVVQSLPCTSQYVATTSQRHQSHLGTSCDVSATF